LCNNDFRKRAKLCCYYEAYREGSFSVKLQGGEMSSVSVMFVAGVQEVNKQIIKEGI